MFDKADNCMDALEGVTAMRTPINGTSQYIITATLHHCTNVKLLLAIVTSSSYPLVINRRPEYTQQEPTFSNFPLLKLLVFKIIKTNHLRHTHNTPALASTAAQQHLDHVAKTESALCV